MDDGLATPPTADRALFDRCAGAYLGLAIGDALGATVEFMTPGEIRRTYGVHRDIVGGGWLKLSPGQVTDDTTMSLALGDAILESRAQNRLFDADLFAQAFARWLRSRPVDCGNTCRRGIQRYLRDGSLQGPFNDGDAGNGALMRNLPVALATLGHPQLCKDVSLAQARITHQHPLSDKAVTGVARILQKLLTGQSDVRGEMQDIVRDEPAFRFSPYPGRSSGYVVDTLQTVLHHFDAFDNFEEALVATVNRGDDADTTGALVGMLAGASCGAARLPWRWLSRLQPALVQTIIEQTSGLLALSQQLAEVSRS